MYWVPAIAISGLTFYDGDKFPAWKGNAFVGGMRNNTGQHVQRVQFNAKGLPTGRELMLGELRQRIREVEQGPEEDGERREEDRGLERDRDERR